MKSQLSAIEQRVYVEATADRIWRALTEAGEFAAWWGGDLAAPLEVGATATLVHQGRAYTFDVDEMTAPIRLSWRWHPGERNATVDYSGEKQTRVTFEIQPFHQGGLLTITETGFDVGALAMRPQALADNINGWLFQAAALYRYLTAPA